MKQASPSLCLSLGEGHGLEFQPQPSPLPVSTYRTAAVKSGNLEQPSVNKQYKARSYNAILQLGSRANGCSSRGNFPRLVLVITASARGSAPALRHPVHGRAVSPSQCEIGQDLISGQPDGLTLANPDSVFGAANISIPQVHLFLRRAPVDGSDDTGMAGMLAAIGHCPGSAPPLLSGLHPVTHTLLAR